MFLLWAVVCSAVGQGACPVDSVVTTNKDGNCTAKQFYRYDEAGRKIEEAAYSLSGGALVGNTRTLWTYYPNGKLQSTSTWSWGSNDWVGDERTDYTYYPSGKTEWIYTYSWGSGDWTNLRASYYEYKNGSGKQILLVTYTGSGTNWIPKTKTINDYDAKGREILSESYSSYNAATDTWVGNKKEVSRFDQYGYQTLEEVYRSWANGVWIGTSKVEYEFDAEGNKLMTANYEWDAANLKWKGKTKEKNVFDSEQRLLITESYSWVNDDWVGSDKKEFTYNNPATTTVSVWQNGAWVYSTRETVTTTNGKVTDKSTYAYSGSDWTIQTQEQHIYMGNNLMQDISYKWMGGTQIGVARTDYEYTSGKKTKTTTYAWDAAQADWVISGYTQLIYSGSQLTEEVSFTYVGGVAVGESHKTYTYGDTKSTTTYMWNSTSSQWEMATYEAKIYSAGVLTSEEKCTYTNGVQTGGNKTLFNGNVTTTQVWNGAWINDQRTTKTYTDGVLTRELTEVWSGTAWTNSKQYELQRNTHGETTLETHSVWQSGKWVISDGTKMEKNYNAAGAVTMVANYQWSAGAWVGTGNKIEYQYDQWGNVSQLLNYKWSSGKWTNSSKNEYAYNASGVVLEQRSWTYHATKGWQGVSWIKQNYDANGNKILYITYTWDATKWDWSGVTNEEYLFTGKVQTGEITYKWDKTNKKWVYKAKTLYTYDAKGNVVEKIKYKYESNQWVESTRTTTDIDDQGRTTATLTYSKVNTNWVLTDESRTTYDQDAQSKKRTELSASYNSGTGVANYSNLITYHYSCDPHFTITTVASPVDGGIITGGGNFKDGAVTTLTATADSPCYSFLQWSDGETSPVRTVSVTSDLTYTAQFIPVPRTITATVKDNLGGSVSIIINP